MMNANPADSGIFRKEALEKQSSPQVLQEQVRLIAPHWWIALLAICVVLSGAALWGWYGRISTKVNGSGMLVPSGGFRHVVSPSDGIIQILNAWDGMPVKAGDVLGILFLPLEQLELDYYQRRLDLMRIEMDGLRKLTEQHKRQRTRLLSRILDGDDDIVKNLENLLQHMTHLNDIYQNLRHTKMITLPEFTSGLRNMLDTAINLTRQHQTDTDREIDKLSYEHVFEREFWQKRRDIQDVEYELAFKMAQFVSRKHVVSHSDGIVVNVQKSDGDHVSAGDVIYTLQHASNDAVHIDALIPATQGKNVRAGQSVHVSPSDTEPHRIGYLVGVVEKVGRYPASLEQLVNLYKNQDLTDMLKGTEAVVTAIIRLIPDTKNPTGFRWTGKAPDQVVIAAGGLCTISVIVEERSPISYVLPWIRQTVLGDARPKTATERNADRE